MVVASSSRPSQEPQKSDAPDPFWGLAHSARRVNLEGSRRIRIAAPLFHIRRRLARYRFASHARRCRLRAGCARECHAMERPAYNPDDHVCGSRGMRDSSNPRPMDTHCRNVDRSARNLAAHGDIWRPLGSPPPRNRCRRSGNVRAGLVVDRCSPIRVEARTSSGSKN